VLLERAELQGIRRRKWHPRSKRSGNRTKYVKQKAKNFQEILMRPLFFSKKMSVVSEGVNQTASLILEN
jgi:hypothetical protein